MDKIGSIPTLGEETKDIDPDKINELARVELIRAHEKVGPQIDGLSSAELKRVLKAVVQFNEVHHMITGEELQLSEKEQKLLDDLFAFKTSLIGFYSVLQENNKEENNE